MIGKSCPDSGMRGGMSGSLMIFAGWVFNFKDTLACSAYVTSKSGGKSKFQEMPAGGSRFPFEIINYSTTNLLPHCLREYLLQMLTVIVFGF